MTIAEVSEKMGLSPDTLRYYERIGLVPAVPRNKSGVRDYGEKDLKWVDFAKCMRSAGLPIEALIDYLALFKQGDETLDARKELLAEQRDRLVEKRDAIEVTIDRLNKKIERYETGLMKKEQDLEW